MKNISMMNQKYINMFTNFLIKCIFCSKNSKVLVCIHYRMFIANLCLTWQHTHASTHTHSENALIIFHIVNVSKTWIWFMKSQTQREIYLYFYSFSGVFFLVFCWLKLHYFYYSHHRRWYLVPFFLALTGWIANENIHKNYHILRTQ